tara:strand:- start:149 stop:412 length:264 start_codon:yes stop_codon:yes gene_type:complete
MANIKINESDVVIKRVSNGWIVNYVSENDSDYVLTKVFEDANDADFKFSSAYSLISTLFYCFDGYFQSKNSAGIVMKLKEKGYDQQQ